MGTFVDENAHKMVTMMVNSNHKKHLHIVLNDKILSDFEEKCVELGTSKSEAGRLLIQAFISGVVTIEFPKIVAVRN